MSGCFVAGIEPLLLDDTALMNQIEELQLEAQDDQGLSPEKPRGAQSEAVVVLVGAQGDPKVVQEVRTPKFQILQSRGLVVHWMALGCSETGGRKLTLLVLSRLIT